MLKRGQMTGGFRWVKIFGAGLGLVLSGNTVMGVQITTDLTLVPETETVNTLETTMTFRFDSVSNTDTESVAISGNVIADLEINNHPLTPTIKSISITGGTISFVDTNFLLVGFALPAPIPVSVVDQSGTPGTTTPPGDVDVLTGEFDAGDHFVNLNNGIITVRFPPIAGGAQEFDLSDPVNQVIVRPTGTSLIGLTPAGAPSGGLAPWEVELNLPVDTFETLFQDGDVAFEISTSGVLIASTSIDLFDLSQTIEGDTDANGFVDFFDFLTLQNNFNQPGDWFDGDYTGDGFVDFFDFLKLQNNFETGPPPQLQAIAEFAALNAPEPGTLAALLLGLPLCVRRKSRKA